MKTTKFKSTISEIMEVPTGDFQHPFLTKAKFIFADNKANANDQGIEADDFDSIATSSIHMPVKMLYAHDTLGGHELSVPIGHITGMYKQVRAEDESEIQLIGEAVLYKEEYPEEVQYLKDKFEKGEAPGISWELSYQDSVTKAGVEWLKGVVTRAATFVRHPAYGNRTSLLAIAQSNILSISQDMMEDETFMTELKEIVQELNDLVQKTETEDDNEDDSTMTMGGIEVNEEEIQKLQDLLAAATAKITELEQSLSEAQASIGVLTEENSGFKKAALVAERTAKIVEAGIVIEDQEVLAQKQELWLTMSPEIFDAYVSDLAEVIKKAKTIESSAASASAKKDSLPKFAVAGQETTLEDLKSVARRASRGELADL